MTLKTAGGNANKEIEDYMRRYQQAKKEYRTTKRDSWKQDMDYWEQRLLASGAMSLRAAALPPLWLGGPNFPIWRKRREHAVYEVQQMEKAGLPNHPVSE